MTQTSENGSSAPSVLIVGTGPAGLFAACELVRHGVRPRIVERRAAPHHETRGTAIKPGVLEILERAGLVEQVLNASVPIRQVMVLGPGLVELTTARFEGIGSRFEFQCSLPQWRTEQILRDRLAEHGVPIEYGTEVEAIDDDPAGLRVTLEKDGRQEVVTVPYLLGAGGAHSVTRHSMHEHLDGQTYGGRYIVADVKLSLPAPPESGVVIVGPGAMVLLSPLPDDRWIIFVNRDEDDVRDEPPTEAELSVLLDSRIGRAAGLHDLYWVSYFKMHKRVVERLGDGRRFLLGDAGHLSSPLGGEGINSALMDGADIAWKLALVLKGAARPSLLASFAVERGAADQHVLDVSDEVHTGVMGLIEMCKGGAEPVVPPMDPEAARALARRRSMLDISYSGSALVGQSGTAVDGMAAGARFSGYRHLSGTTHHLVTFGEARMDGLRERWEPVVTFVEGASLPADPEDGPLPRTGAVLVRPDGYIGYCLCPADDAGLSALDAHLGTYLLPNAGR